LSLFVLFFLILSLFSSHLKTPVERDEEAREKEEEGGGGGDRRDREGSMQKRRARKAIIAR
ncbi:hypothetical protein CSUI_008821, partial [Cystoisospora suis]